MSTSPHKHLSRRVALPVVPMSCAMTTSTSVLRSLSNSEPLHLQRYSPERLQFSMRFKMVILLICVYRLYFHEHGKHRTFNSVATFSQGEIRRGHIIVSFESTSSTYCSTIANHSRTTNDHPSCFTLSAVRCPRIIGPNSTRYAPQLLTRARSLETSQSSTTSMSIN